MGEKSGKSKKSLSWFSLIFTEINHLEKIAEPFQPVNPENENVMGELTEEELRLYTLALMTNKEADDYIYELNFIGDSKQIEVTLKKILELKTKSEVLKMIFWISVRDRLDLWFIESLGIRKGRKVVIANDDSFPFLNFS